MNNKPKLQAQQISALVCLTCWGNGIVPTPLATNCAIHDGTVFVPHLWCKDTEMHHLVPVNCVCPSCGWTP